MPSAVRSVARWIGEIGLLWLMAATATAAFLPWGFGLNALDQPAFVNPTTLQGLAVAAAGLGITVALWWLLTREMANQLALAAMGLLALAFVLPGGLTTYFLPPPLLLLLAAFLIARFPAAGPPRPRR